MISQSFLFLGVELPINGWVLGKAWKPWNSPWIIGFFYPRLLNPDRDRGNKNHHYFSTASLISYPGWWFGTFLYISYFSICWEFHHPNWRTPSFFRGGSTTNHYGCNGHGVGPYFGRKMVAIWGFLSHGGTQIIHFVGGFFFPAIGASPFFPILRNLHIAF